MFSIAKKCSLFEKCLRCPKILINFKYVRRLGKQKPKKEKKQEERKRKTENKKKKEERKRKRKKKGSGRN